jgi:hypothetical protein
LQPAKAKSKVKGKSKKQLQKQVLLPFDKLRAKDDS